MKALIIFTLGLIYWQTPTTEIYQVDGLAIAGYDAVSYHNEGSAIKGSDEFVYSWKSATWQFASAQNLALFKENPSKYAPQFGGYCAWGMREGYKAETDPVNAWTVTDGLLYLNYNKAVQEGWLSEMQKSIDIADKNWSTFHPKNETKE